MHVQGKLVLSEFNRLYWRTEIPFGMRGAAIDCKHHIAGPSPLAEPGPGIHYKMQWTC
jgi:hypothetical protein